MDTEGWLLSLLTQLGAAECRDDLEDGRAIGVFLTQCFGVETVEDLFLLLLRATHAWKEGREIVKLPIRRNKQRHVRIYRISTPVTKSSY